MYSSPRFYSAALWLKLSTIALVVKNLNLFAIDNLKKHSIQKNRLRIFNNCDVSPRPTTHA